MNEYELKRIWKKNLREFNDLMRLESIIIISMQESIKEAQTKQCNIADVSHCADELEPITANITGLGFTTPSDHGIIELELPYQHHKIKGWKKGDKIEIKHCG